MTSDWQRTKHLNINLNKQSPTKLNKKPTQHVEALVWLAEIYYTYGDLNASLCTNTQKKGSKELHLSTLIRRWGDNYEGMTVDAVHQNLLHQFLTVGRYRIPAA